MGLNKLFVRCFLLEQNLIQLRKQTDLPSFMEDLTFNVGFCNGGKRKDIPGSRMRVNKDMET
jgi:hypothetical protein